ncbi:hypothetical protein [Alienimonas chondri]|uniref:hypothetical protein n=1 Tax=Alienimonas chondri TaxID=2681879 RepID=UPI001489EF61|nr:hypothetical protein [Alienimonas chondri]
MPSTDATSNSFAPAPPPGEEPDPLAFLSVAATCAGRLAAVAGLWALCAAVVWMWWPQWRADFSRTEPWLAALSWWGELASVAWATAAILTGRLTWSGFGRPDPTGRRTRPGENIRTLAVAGVLLSLTADLLITLGGFWADRRAWDDAKPNEGIAVAADRIPADRKGNVDVRLHVRFLLPPNPQPPFLRLQEGTTTVRLPRPPYDPDASEIGPDRLSPHLAAWAWRTAHRQPAAPLTSAPLRYDPDYPGRFWIDGQSWDRGAPSRLLLAFLPILQAGMLIVWLRDSHGGAIPDPFSEFLARHLPAFPLATELLFLGGWGLLENGWLR